MWKAVGEQRVRADKLGDRIQHLEHKIEDYGDVDQDIVNSNKYNHLRASKERLFKITRRRMPLLFGRSKRDAYLNDVEARINDLETHLANKKSPEGKEFLKWLEDSIGKITALYESKFNLGVPRSTGVNLIKNILRTKERTEQYIQKLENGSFLGFVAMDGFQLPYDHSFGGRKRKTKRPRRFRTMRKMKRS